MLNGERQTQKRRALWHGGTVAATGPTRSTTLGTAGAPTVSPSGRGGAPHKSTELSEALRGSHGHARDAADLLARERR